MPWVIHLYLFKGSYTGTIGTVLEHGYNIVTNFKQHFGMLMCARCVCVGYESGICHV